jgi:DNA-binding transcriptional regulator YiaG
MRKHQLQEVAEVRALLASGEARRMREQARVSLAEMARHVGCAHSSVLRWEEGRRVPSEDNTLRYGRLLNLLGRRDDGRVRAG